MSKIYFHRYGLVEIVLAKDYRSKTGNKTSAEHICHSYQTIILQAPISFGILCPERAFVVYRLRAVYLRPFSALDQAAQCSGQCSVGHLSQQALTTPFPPATASYMHCVISGARSFSISLGWLHGRSLSRSVAGRTALRCDRKDGRKLDEETSQSAAEPLRAGRPRRAPGRAVPGRRGVMAHWTGATVGRLVTALHQSVSLTGFEDFSTMCSTSAAASSFLILTCTICAYVMQYVSLVNY